MDIKSAAIDGLKAGPDDDLEEGEFTAYVSTWTRTPDSYGDVVKQGAFKQTIRDWAKSGNQMPILYGHRMEDPDYFLGGAKSMVEDDHGLLVHASLDLDNPKALRTYKLIKGRRINQMSFAYDTLEDGMVEVEDGVKARELRKLKVYEASIVPIGANQDTEILAVKALVDSVKSGRVLSAKNLSALKNLRTSLDGAIITLDDVINVAAVEETDSDEASSNGASADEAQAGKSATPRVKSAELVAFWDAI